MSDLVDWGRERASDVAALVPEIAAEDVVRVLWDDVNGFVIGLEDGSAMVAGITRGDTGFVRCLAVAPQRRRRRLGTALLDAAVARLATPAVAVGGEAPFYLWPGVDASATAALAFFEGHGFARVGVELNMTCSSAHTADPPPGVRIERVTDGGRVVEFVRAQWPHWVPEVARAIELGTCFVASSGDGVVGFVGHSVNRQGWLGPMGTTPVKQGGGVGTALVAAVCADAREAGRASVEIAWVGPVGFYAKAVGAVVSRTFVRMRSRSSR